MTTVHLYKDIGLNMSMKKTIDFTSKDAQNQWFTSHTHTTVNDVAFNKLQNQLHLPMDYGSALEYTYVVFENLDQSGRRYYYFISDCALIDDSIVAFTLVLDPIQTFMCEFELDECMVTREHKDRWGSGSDPIRITPNQEGIDAYYKCVADKGLTGADSEVMLLVITYTSPRLKFTLEFTGSSSNVEDYELDKGVFYGIALVSTQPSATGIKFRASYDYKYGSDNRYIGTKTMIFPSLADIINGTFQSSLPIPDNAVISINMVPACYFDLTYITDPVTGERIYIFNNGSPEQDLHINVGGGRFWIDEVNAIGFLSLADRVIIDTNDSSVDFGNDKAVVVRSPTQILGDKYTEVIPVATWKLPVKPTDSSDASDTHEPALYMEPYTSRKIIKNDGTVVHEFSDKNLTVRNIVCANLLSSGGVQNIFVHTTDTSIAYGTITQESAEGEVGMCDSPSLDVVNDEWKNYVYTKRDTDRQLVSNQAWQRALDNLFFMSYGGALVGSRSASGRDDPMKNKKAAGLTPKFNANMIGAVGLAAAASVATSLIDAHYMWQNQMLKEKQIRNESTSITQMGTGVQSVMMKLSDYKYVTLQVDDINWNRAYENFRKYGYLVNQFEKPDIRSRKYFNYILTNGAIIRGNIPQSVKDIIASVFDNGITIFHGDYTTTLDYDDITKENIERVLI